MYCIELLIESAATLGAGSRTAWKTFRRGRLQGRARRVRPFLHHPWRILPGYRSSIYLPLVIANSIRICFIFVSIDCCYCVFSFMVLWSWLVDSFYARTQNRRNEKMELKNQRFLSRFLSQKNNGRCARLKASLNLSRTKP